MFIKCVKLFVHCVTLSVVTESGGGVADLATEKPHSSPTV